MTSTTDSHDPGAVRDENSNMNLHGKHGDDEDRKLFLGGLSWDTNEDDIRSYFSKFGNVLDVSVKYDAITRNPRGFGFITFAEDNAIDNVIATAPHTIKNKVIDPKRAKSRPICKKVFVGGIDANVSEDEIKKYFSRYGKVEGIELPYDRTKGRRREFCFIIFDTEENADRACKEAKQTIGNRECDIKKAQPQPVAQQQKRLQQAAQNNSVRNPNGVYNTPGFAYEDYTNYGFPYSDGDTRSNAKKRVTAVTSSAIPTAPNLQPDAQNNFNNYSGFGFIGTGTGQGQPYYNNYYQYGQNVDYYNQHYGFSGGYGDYYQYPYAYGAEVNNPSTEYNIQLGGAGAGEQNFGQQAVGGAGNGGSGHSSQSSTHSAHQGGGSSGKVARKNAPSATNHTYHPYPYRNTSSH